MTVLDTVAPTSSGVRLASSLRAILRELESFPDLYPSPLVNDTFARLVELVLDAAPEAAEQVLDDPEVRELAPRLRELCGHGEAELEMAWAVRVARSARPRRELELFPYLENYRRLSSMEATVLRDVADRPIRSLAFGGSGPMPLSSCFLARDLGVPVDNLDRDADAVAASSDLATVLRWSELRFHRADVRDTSLSGYDAVVLAALVGATAAEKRELVDHLASSMSPGALLLIRSARGLRTLLYPEVGAEVLTGLDVLTVVHPSDDVINSVIVARVRGTSPAEGAPRHDDGIPEPRTGRGH